MNNWKVSCQYIGYILRKLLILISHFSNLKWITYDFFSLRFNIFNSQKMKNHLQNHLRGQIYPVSTVGWPLLFGFIVKDWILNFCNNSRI